MADPAPTRPAPRAAQGDLRVHAHRLMQRCLADVRGHGHERDRQDWENLLFYRGGIDGQWIVWDRATERYIPRGDDPERGGLPAWMPRCVSNKFSVKIDGIAAILNQADPAYEFGPGADTDSDRATAEVCEDAVPVLWEECGYTQGNHRSTLNHLACLLDKVAYVVYYDGSEQYGTADIPLLQCSACQATISPSAAEEAATGLCPECGAQDSLTIALNPDGSEQGIAYPIGRLCGEVLPSFEFSLPSNARTTDTRVLPWVLTHSRMAVEEAMRLFPEARAAIEAAASANTSGGLGRAYADAMSRLGSARSLSDAGASTRSVLVYRLQHDPLEDEEFKLPDGLHAVQIGDEIVYAEPLPVKDERGRPQKSILVRTFQRMPGTSAGKPPADDLVPLQKVRNTLETLNICIALHHAAPRTFIPLSVSLEDPITGAPGEQVRYSSTVPGEKPTTEAGGSPPEGLFKLLEVNDAEFEEVSRLNAVLAGARPEGDPTLGEVRILQERGIAAFSTPLLELIEFEKQLALLALRVARDSMWHPRFRKVRGENGEWELRQFSAADLAGSIDVQVEPASAWPKSPLMQLLSVDKAIQIGALPPPATDPELQQQVLALMNLAELKPSLDLDRKQIARKLDRWKNATTPQEVGVPDPLAENLLVHRHFCTLFLKTEEAEAMVAERPEVYAAIRLHIQQIELLLAQQQMAAAAAAAGPPPPDERTAREKGDDSAMQGALQSGALVPAGAEGGGGPTIEELMAGGVLQPAQAPPGAVQ